MKLRGKDFDRYPRNILLIYDNMPLPHLNHDTVAAHCADKLRGYWSEGLSFDAVFLESRDTIFQIDSDSILKLRIYDVWRDA